jgi:hypothetical protein
MKKGRQHSIDKLFLESLGGHQITPSPATWASLSKQVPAKAGRSTLLYLLSGVAIGAFVFLMHSVLLYDSGETTTEVTAISESTEIENTSQVATKTTSTETKETDINSTESLSTQTTISSSTEKTPVQSTTSPSGTTPVILLSQQNKGAEKQNEDGYANRSLLSISMAGSINDQVEANSTMGIRESSERDYPDPIFDLNARDSYAKPADVYFGAAFSPSVNIYPDAQNRNDYSLEFVASIEKSRFLIETGIGGNYTSESAEYRVNYTTFDSVGFYVGVTSFTVDPVNPDSVIFQTNLKNLYDSIDRFTILENTNKYAYLQIPLRLGYRVIQMPRFSVDLKAGLLFSIQIYKDIPGVPYQGNDVEIEVVRQYPDRLTTTWQYTAGIGMNYHVNNKMRFTIEPFYRQYIKSAYSPSSEFPARSPYAFGLRAGLYFHF